MINEYLEEALPTPPLLPKDLIQHDQARMVNFADVEFGYKEFGRKAGAANKD
jgi:glutathione S-transferase